MTNKDLPVVLRQILIRSEFYGDLPQEFVHGLMQILCLATSEAVAETYGSLINKLHLCYCNTDPDNKCVQRGLKLRLVGPEPSTPEDEKVILSIAKILVTTHPTPVAEHPWWVAEPKILANNLGSQDFLAKALSRV